MAKRTFERKGVGAWMLAAALTTGCDDGGASGARTTPADASATPADAAVAYTPPTTWTVVLEPDAPEAVQWAAEDVRDYLERMGQTARIGQPGIEIECEPGVGRVQLGPLPDAASDQTWSIRETRCGANGARVQLLGGGLPGQQFAAYEWLHTLGVRFFHPEEEHVPATPSWPDAALVRTHTPAFRWRSVSLHLSHPLELGDAFRRCDERYLEEARRYIDWQVKNGASYGTGGACGGDRGHRRGFPRSSGFSLYNQQQGASGILDPDDPRTDEEQIAAAIEARMDVPEGERPMFFSLTFNPTEFTEADDQTVVRQLTFIADYFTEHYPDVYLQAINHGTHGEPTPHYGVRYYDLPRFAPRNLGVTVHTLMFFDLFRPAPVYGNEDFGFLFEFMSDQYRKRRLWYFPESAWWLTFDIGVPLYLPINLEARQRDIEGIAFMLEGGLDGHRMFGSGHEWGYWQNEYCAFRMAADLDYDHQDCLADLTLPMGPAAGEVVAVLSEVIRLQARDLVFGTLLAWLAGTDPETEAAAGIGVQFHPLPPAPTAILRWDAAALDAWEADVRPALERMDAEYAALVARLGAVAGQVPEAGAPWFREVVDGIEVTGLRARHAHQVYGALVTKRRAMLAGDEALHARADALLTAARETTEAARAVVARREADYRYRPVSRSVAGGADGTEDENWTIYRYRVLNRPHHVYYYARIDRLAEEAMAGAAASEAVHIADALLAPDEALHVAVSAPGGAEIDFGDGATARVDAASEGQHTYAAPGAYTVAARGEDFEVELPVAALQTAYETGRTGEALEPAGVAIIEPLLPGLVFGPIGAGAAAIGFDIDGTAAVAPDRWTRVALAAGAAAFATAAADLRVPVVNRGEVLTELPVLGAVLTRDDVEARMAGELPTDDLIAAIVGVGGFEPEGARRLVASLLGYTPDTLPERLPFVVRWPN